MREEDPSVRDRLVVILIGLVVLLTPALILVLTLGFLSYSEDLLLERVTALELVELYLLDLVVVLALGAVLYWLFRAFRTDRLPDAIETALDPTTNDEDPPETGEESDRE